MDCAQVDEQPTQPIQKLGLVGDGGVIHLPSECCSFLKDAAEHIEDGIFAVPFSAAALRVLASFCSAPPKVRHASARLIDRLHIFIHACLLSRAGYPRCCGEANGRGRARCFNHRAPAHEHRHRATVRGASSGQLLRLRKRAQARQPCRRPHPGIDPRRSRAPRRRPRPEPRQKCTAYIVLVGIGPAVVEHVVGAGE